LDWLFELIGSLVYSFLLAIGGLWALSKFGVLTYDHRLVFPAFVLILLGRWVFRSKNKSNTNVKNDNSVTKTYKQYFSSGDDDDSEVCPTCGRPPRGPPPVGQAQVIDLGKPKRTRTQTIQEDYR